MASLPAIDLDWRDKQHRSQTAEPRAEQRTMWQPYPESYGLELVLSQPCRKRGLSSLPPPVEKWEK